MTKFNIKNLYYSNNFIPIDYHFARFITSRDERVDRDLFLASGLLSRVTREGDVCLDLGKWAGRTIDTRLPDDFRLTCPQFKTWRQKLSDHSMVGRPGEYFPLILDEHDRLYLHRYWEYETQLADAILERAGASIPAEDFSAAQAGWHQIFTRAKVRLNSEQLLTLIVSFYKRICIISGGPGTGKTATIANIIAFLLAQRQVDPLRIWLSAPTGKAAARLADAVTAHYPEAIAFDQTATPFAARSFTIHRMLKPLPHSPHFFYTSDNPLPADLVVVDEASMVDLPLMFKLVQALPPNARLILCGDKDQLASVETGSVLADMCGEPNENRYSKRFAGQIEALTQGRLDKVGYTVCDDPAPLEDCRVLLSQTYRFQAHSDIHRVSQGVNAGDGPKTLQLLRQSNGATVAWRAQTSPQAIYTALAKIIIERYRKFFSAATPQVAVDELNRFKVLCAVQRGPWGAQTINHQIENDLIKAGLINPIDGNPWYPGRPILITRNHHARGLYNGDMGLTLPVRDDRPMELRVYFPGDDEKMRVMMPSVLPEHETAYAMTVHKSQGSEFQDVALVLPENDSPVLTKELLYTGMTRTRRRITIWSSEETLVRTIARRIDRSSGLHDRLQKRPA